MLYDNELKLGVRRQYLPELNPQKAELPKYAKLTDVFEKAKELFFHEVEVDLQSMCLTDSSGVLIPVDADGHSLLSIKRIICSQPTTSFMLLLRRM